MDSFRPFLRWLVLLAAASPLLAQSPVRSLYRLDGALTAPSDRDAEVVVRDFLAGAPAPGVRAAGGFELRAASRAALAGGAVERVTLERRLAGVPLYGGETHAFVDESGRLLRLTQAPPPAPPTTLATALTPRQALEAAGDAAGWTVEASGAGPELTTRFAGPGEGWGVVSLVWFDRNGQAVPAWRVDAQTGPSEAFETLVDARTGEILLRAPLVREQAPTGLVFAGPSEPYPGGQPRTSESFAGWEAGDCPNEPSPGQADACWTAGQETVGNNADVCLDLDKDNLCDVRAYSTGGAFDFTFSDAYNLSNDPAPDRNAALANAFYWVNVAHDWLYRLGFDEAAGAFQTDNYGRGGSDGDPVYVDVQDGGTINNANFLTPPDGIAARMQLGLFTATRRDSAFDADVMLHEYAHGVSNRLVGGPASVVGLYLWHSGGMGEGWSDAYAFSFAGDPVVGEYVTRNAASGIRTVRYDQSPHTFGDFGRLRPVLIPGTTIQAAAPQVHYEGEIWASTLWDLREALGKDLFERTMTLGLALTPNRPSMLDARDAFLQAGQTLGAASCAMWSAFAARGMGASAALNPVQDGQPNDTALSVFEAFDEPASCGGAPPALPNTLLLESAEDDPGESGWTPSGLWHRSTRRAAGGVRSWYFGREETGDYATGARESGYLTSPPIDLTSATAATLEWDQFLRGEGFLNRVSLGGFFSPYLNKDAGIVWVSTDDGATWKVLTHLAHNSPGTGFAHHRVNLSEYAGSVIRVRFGFDTYDELDNAHEGWYVDDIRVGGDGEGNHFEPGVESLEATAVTGGGVVTVGQIPLSSNVEWTAEATGGSDLWMSANPSSGSGDAQVEVRADLGRLPPGVHEGNVRFSSAAGDVDVPVTLTVTPSVTPLHHWTFDETGGGAGVTLADSVSGRAATTAGAGSADVAGVSGRARLFNGFTDAAVAPFAATPERFTLRAWVRLDGLPDSLGVIASEFDGSAARGWFLAIDSAGRPVFMGAAPPSSTPWLVAPDSLGLGAWRLLTATVDRTTGFVRLFIDHEEAASATFPGVAAPETAPLTFGQASWATTYRLHGAIDDVQLFTGIQSAVAVAADFDAYSVPQPVGTGDVGGQWGFDDGTTSVDASGNGFTATGDGVPIPGVSGEALRFDGASDSRLAQSADERLAAPSFSVQAWVRLEAAPAAWGALVAHYDGAYSGWYLGVLPSGRAFFAAGARPSSLPSVESNSGIADGRWHLLTAVYEGRIQRMSLYLDGVLEQRRYTSGFTPRTSGPLTIGRASWSDAHYTAFDIDELSVWRRNLAPSEIASYYSASAPLDAPGALAAWSFDETATGPGTTFADSVGGHTATTSGSRNTPLSGVAGVARRFGGWPDSAQMAADADFATSSFTFSTWVRIDETPQSWGVLFSDYGGGFAGWYVGLYHDGRIIFSVCGPDSKPWLLSGASLEVGRWHHLAVSFEGASRRGLIYLDGVRVGSAVFPAWEPATGVAPTWGRASWVDSVYLKFSIDEARLYGYERTPEEIAGDYAALADGATPTPLAAWEFEDIDEVDPLAVDTTGGGHTIDLTQYDFQTAGVTGEARAFTGRPSHGLMSPSAELGAATFTWMSWVKLDSLPGGWGALYSNFGGSERGWYAGLYTDGRVIFSVSGPGSSPWLLSDTALTPGQWHHVAVTFDAVSRIGTIVIDGVVDRTAVFPASAPETDVSPAWGRASWTDSYYLPATVDRARFFAGALTAAQVRDWQ